MNSAGAPDDLAAQLFNVARWWWQYFTYRGPAAKLLLQKGNCSSPWSAERSRRAVYRLRKAHPEADDILRQTAVFALELSEPLWWFDDMEAIWHKVGEELTRRWGSVSEQQFPIEAVKLVSRIMTSVLFQYRLPPPADSAGATDAISRVSYDAELCSSSSSSSSSDSDSEQQEEKQNDDNRGRGEEEEEGSEYVAQPDPPVLMIPGPSDWDAVITGFRPPQSLPPSLPPSQPISFSASAAPPAIAQTSALSVYPFLPPYESPPPVYTFMHPPLVAHNLPPPILNGPLVSYRESFPATLIPINQGFSPQTPAPPSLLTATMPPAAITTTTPNLAAELARIGQQAAKQWTAPSGKQPASATLGPGQLGGPAKRLLSTGGATGGARGPAAAAAQKYQDIEVVCRDD